MKIKKYDDILNEGKIKKDKFSKRKFKEPTLPEEPYKRKLTKKEEDFLNKNFIEHSFLRYIDKNGNILLGNGMDDDKAIFYITEDDLEKFMGELTNESKDPMSDSKVMSRLTKGFAIQVDEEDYDKFFDLIDEYGDLYPGGINYNRIGIKTKPAKLYFVLIGNQIYHTTTPKFGGEDLEVYIPVF